MMARTQITLDPEIQSRAHKRASKLGVSFAEYVRSLIARISGDPKGSGYIGGLRSRLLRRFQHARDKDAMVGEAFDSLRARRTRS